MKWCWVFLWCACLGAADVPRLYYTKSFPGSVPPYVAVTLDRTGSGVYKEAPDDDRPLSFQLSEPEVAEIFGLVEKLVYHAQSGVALKFFEVSLFEGFLNDRVFWIGEDDVAPASQLQSPF